MNDYDLLIAGAGPAGISLAAEAVAAGIRNDRVLIVEKSEVHSWAIRKYYPEQKVVTANYKGQAAVCHGVMCIADQTKTEVLSYLDQAIGRHGLTVHYRETVLSIAPTGEGFTVTTDKGTYRTTTCAIAIGIFGKPNQPGYKLPGCLKARIHFDISSAPIADADVLVVGGGDSASEYAQYLVEAGNRVTLAYRQAELARMNDINRDSLLALGEQGRVRLQLSTDITAVTADHGSPRVQYADSRHPDETFDHIVYALGGTTPTHFLKAIGIRFDGDEPCVTDGYETSAPGLFLIGDLSAGRKGGSIISAFNSANAAMQQICRDHLECNLPY